jgi:hypothetical protein
MAARKEIPTRFMMLLEPMAQSPSSTGSESC